MAGHFSTASDTLLFNFQITERTKVPGGDINDCYMISDNERYFVLNQREFLPKFEIEAENLRSLRNTSTVYVPELVLIGKPKSARSLSSITYRLSL